MRFLAYSKIFLGNQNFTGINLREAHMKCINLSNSNLSSANLYHCDITNSHLDRVNLSNAVLKKTILSEMKPLLGHTGIVKSVCFSKDGKKIVSGSKDSSIRIWNAETGEQLEIKLKGHSDEVYSVCFSPDGKKIVSGSED